MRVRAAQPDLFIIICKREAPCLIVDELLILYRYLSMPFTRAYDMRAEGKVDARGARGRDGARGACRREDAR